MEQTAKRSTRSPRYVTLADQLAREIDTGKYGLGDLLPPELVLSRSHKVSRHTVREALRRLTDMGLISRRRRTGTTITAKSPQTRYTASLSSIAELFQYQEKPRYQILSEKPVSANAHVAAMLGCRRGTKWLKFEALRHQTGVREPISYTEFYVDPAYKEVGASLRRKNPLIYAFVERDFEERVTEIRQEVRAAAVPVRAAALLKAKPRSPGLHIIRRFLVHGERVIAIASSIYPEGRFHVTLRWKVQWHRERAAV